MLFDQLCKFVERNLPDERLALELARLFRLERRELRRPRSEHVSWEPDARVVENFRVPFPVVAIEDSGKRDACGKLCVAFKEIDRAAREFKVLTFDDIRLVKSRVAVFPDVAILEGDWMERAADIRDVEVYCRKTGKLTLVKESLDRFNAEIGPGTDISGDMRITADLSDAPDWVRERYEGKTLDYADLGVIEAAKRTQAESAGKLKEYFDRRSEDFESAIAGMGVVSGILQALLVCDPSTFVVEETTPACDSKPKGGKIRRSSRRPHYIILKPREIRTRLLGEQEESSGTGSRRPHERRGHYKLLQSDRYTNKRGQTIWVKACWVGPQEGVVGKNRYKVRIDL